MAMMAPTARCFAVCKTPQDVQKKKPLDQRPKVQIDTMFVKSGPFLHCQRSKAEKVDQTSRA